jgi:hypothetical protein
VPYICDSGRADTLKGGFYTFSEDGKYLLSTIEHETPEGFLVYDLKNHHTIFSTDTLVSSEWKFLGGGNIFGKDYPPKHMKKILILNTY